MIGTFLLKFVRQSNGMPYHVAMIIPLISLPQGGEWAVIAAILLVFFLVVVTIVFGLVGFRRGRVESPERPEVHDGVDSEPGPPFDG